VANGGSLLSVDEAALLTPQLLLVREAEELVAPIPTGRREALRNRTWRSYGNRAVLIKSTLRWPSGSTADATAYRDRSARKRR
jgi:hypothetical protein